MLSKISNVDSVEPLHLMDQNKKNSQTNGKDKDTAIKKYADDVEHDGVTLVQSNLGLSYKKKELIRIISQSLRDLGFETSAKHLEEESKVKETDSKLDDLKTLILNGEWDKAIDFLDNILNEVSNNNNNNNNEITNGNVIVKHSIQEFKNKTSLLRKCEMLIWCEVYKEFVEAGDFASAVDCLRKVTHMSNLNNHEHLMQIKSLSLMLLDANNKNITINHHMQLNSDKKDNICMKNREELFKKICSYLPTFVSLPPQRLLDLLDNSILGQVFYMDMNLSKNDKKRMIFGNSYVNTAKNNGKYIVPLDDDISSIELEKKQKETPSSTIQVITDHNDEVWLCSFSNNGYWLGSTSKNIVILYKVNYKILKNIKKRQNEKIELELACKGNKITRNNEYDDKKNENNHNDKPLHLAIKLKGHTDSIYCLAWSPDDYWLITGDGKGKIILWEVACKNETNSMFESLSSSCIKDEINSTEIDAHIDRVCAITWMSDSMFLTGSFDGSVHLYNTALNLLAYWTDAPIYDIAYIPRLEVLAISCSESPHIRLLIVNGLFNNENEGNHCSSTSLSSKIDNGKNKQTFNLKEIPLPPQVFEDMKCISNLQICQDGKSLFTQYGRDGGNIFEWEIASGKIISNYNSIHNKNAVLRASIGGCNESILACGSLDSTIALWMLNKERTSEIELQSNFEKISSSSNSSSSNICANTQYKSYKPIKYLKGHTQPVNDIAWSPKEKGLLVSASDDLSLRVWL